MTIRARGTREPGLSQTRPGRLLQIVRRSRYPTLVIGPGESIEVRVDGDIKLCGSAFDDLADCRRVLVAASPGDSVELEVVPHDSSKRMALTLRPDAWFVDDPDLSVRRLMVPPGGVPYVLGAGTATLTTRH